MYFKGLQCKKNHLKIYYLDVLSHNFNTLIKSFLDILISKRLISDSRGIGGVVATPSSSYSFLICTFWRHMLISWFVSSA